MTISCKEKDAVASPKNLHIRVANTGDREIVGSLVQIGEYQTSPGILAVNTSAGHLFFNHPLADYATVSFEYENGEKFTKTVQIKGVIPDKIKGDLELIFNIDSNTNEVSLDYNIE
jgi:hypothetical protein